MIDLQPFECYFGACIWYLEFVVILCLDLFYFDRCVILAVPIGFAKSLAPPVLKDEEFLAPSLFHHFRRDHG
jgi:hypothetical protein